MDVDGAIAEAQAIIQDTTYTDAWMLERLNIGLNEIAAVFCLPGQSTTSMVTALASANQVPMPADFHHSLFLATTLTYPQGLLLAPNVKELVRSSSPYITGPVNSVAVEHKTLHYRPVPTESEEINLYYYKKIKPLYAGMALPSWLPEHLQMDVCVNYLCREAFTQIEDGIDGNMPNTNKYGNRFAAAMFLLRQFYPNAAKARPETQRNLVWF